MSTETSVKERQEVEEGQTEAKQQSEAKSGLSPKIQKVIQAVEELTVVELASLVRALETKFGVSAQAAAAVSVPGTAAGDSAQAAGPAEEKTSFQVILTSAGEKKIQVIKEIRAVTNLGLKEAKDLVESTPKPVKDNATKEEAAKIKALLEAAGAKVEVK